MLGFCGKVIDIREDKEFSKYWSAKIEKRGRKIIYPFKLKIEPIIVNNMFIMTDMINKIKNLQIDDKHHVRFPDDEIKSFIKRNEDIDDVLSVLSEYNEFLKKVDVEHVLSYLRTYYQELITRGLALPAFYSVSYIEYRDVIENIIEYIKTDEVLAQIFNIIQLTNDEKRPSIFSLKNIYIIATANTADLGALGRIGFALMRRFPIVYLVYDHAMKENLKLLASKLLGDSIDDIIFKEAFEVWERVKRLVNEKVRGFIDAKNIYPGWSYIVDHINCLKECKDFQENCDRFCVEATYGSYIQHLNIKVNEILGQE